MAARLAAAVDGIDGVEITPPGRGQRRLRPAAAAGDRPPARELCPGEHPFYVWDDSSAEVRWMCAWDTAEADVDRFAAAVAAATG